MGPVELPFWRTLARYLVSIVASLACGFLWFVTGAKLLNLHTLLTIYSGVVALALGFLLMGFLWLSLDLGRPAPEGVNEKDRAYQLFFLWMGVPLLVLAVVIVVAIVAVILGATVLRGGVPR